MKTIYKYPIESHINKIELYKGAKILSAGHDPLGTLCIWALVDTSQEKEIINFYLAGTGWEMPECALEFIDTIKEGPYMWHLFMADEKTVHTYFENLKKEI